MPTPTLQSRPRIGISSCLLGEKVRYDGGHKHQQFLTGIFGQFVEWMPVCPEFEVGMGVPREPVRLVEDHSGMRMIADRSGKDWTSAMQRFSSKRVRELKKFDLCGFILKKDSPSCGMERVKVFGHNGPPERRGRGLFAETLMSALPLLPVEEEGRLNDPKLRENFIERVFAYDRWRALRAKPTRRALVEFHAQHKFQLMAHHEPTLRKLGRIVAHNKGTSPVSLCDKYGELFMKALQHQATVKRNVNVLQHMAGFFTDHLNKEERAELQSVIRDYHRGLVPLIVPITLVRHFARKFDLGYIKDQMYLNPHPKELMLRNHV